MNQEQVRKRGRPKKPYDELSVITKRQNSKKLREELSIEELGFTLEKSLKAAGFVDASKVVKKLIERPATGSEYIKSRENQRNIFNYTPDEALALSVDMKLSKNNIKKCILEQRKGKFVCIHRMQNIDCKETLLPFK